MLLEADAQRLSGQYPYLQSPPIVNRWLDSGITPFMYTYGAIDDPEWKGVLCGTATFKATDGSWKKLPCQVEVTAGNFKRATAIVHFTTRTDLTNPRTCRWDPHEATFRLEKDMVYWKENPRMRAVPLELSHEEVQKLVDNADEPDPPPRRPQEPRGKKRTADESGPPRKGRCSKAKDFAQPNTQTAPTSLPMKQSSLNSTTGQDSNATQHGVGLGGLIEAVGTQKGAGGVTETMMTKRGDTSANALRHPDIQRIVPEGR